MTIQYWGLELDVKPGDSFTKIIMPDNNDFCAVIFSQNMERLIFMHLFVLEYCFLASAVLWCLVLSGCVPCCIGSFGVWCFTPLVFSGWVLLGIVW